MIEFCVSLDGVVVDDKVLKKLYISEANKQRDSIIDMASKWSNVQVTAKG